MTEYVCAYSECNNKFVKSTHNQKYCSDECCRTATNLKIKERYYENKARLGGKKRVCKAQGCTTQLSRYNEEPICTKCASKDKSKKKNEILRMIKG